MDKFIYQRVCMEKGHEIRSVAETPAYDPGRQMSHPRYKILCTQCGADLEEISKPKRSKPSKPKEEKPVEKPAEGPKQSSVQPPA